MRKNVILNYILLTFLVAWLLWFGLMLLINSKLVLPNSIIYNILYILGGICPSITALIAIRGDNNSQKRLRTEIFKFKTSILWYVGIIVIPLILSAISWLLNLTIEGKSNDFIQKPIYYIIPILPIMIIGGGLEEIGWRGLLLVKLIEKFSPLKSTIIISVIWGIWHLPLWFVKGVPQYGTNFIIFLFGVFSLSFLLTVLYIGTRSIFLCILFHALENAYLNIGMDSWASETVSVLITAILPLVLSIFIFFIYFKIKPYSAIIGGSDHP